MAGEIGHWCGIDFIGGGLGSVDKIDGAVLQDKEGFLVITPTVFAPFTLDVDSGAGESSPQRIAPNTNPGDKRWILTGGVFAGLTLYGNIVMPDGGSIGQADGPLVKFDNTNNFLEISGCKVGLDVVTPFTSLHIGRLATGYETVDFEDASQCAIFVTAPATTNYYQPLIGVGYAADTFVATICAYDDGPGAAAGFAFFTGDTNAITEQMRITAAGKIGVHDLDPNSELDVTGDINTTVDYKVDDVKVVSNQGAVVADATDPATTMARLNDLLARCRAHGLIAT